MPAKNIKELRDQLLDDYDRLRKDPRAVVQVGELANVAGKIISSAKVELEYAALKKERPAVDFLEYPRK